jgi:hypothetical protein
MFKEDLAKKENKEDKERVPKENNVQEVKDKTTEVDDKDKDKEAKEDKENKVEETTVNKAEEGKDDKNKKEEEKKDPEAQLNKLNETINKLKAELNGKNREILILKKKQEFENNSKVNSVDDELVNLKNIINKQNNELNLKNKRISLLLKNSDLMNIQRSLGIESKPQDELQETIRKQKKELDSKNKEISMLKRSKDLIKTNYIQLLKNKETLKKELDKSANNTPEILARELEATKTKVAQLSDENKQLKDENNKLNENLRNTLPTSDRERDKEISDRENNKLSNEITTLADKKKNWEN